MSKKTAKTRKSNKQAQTTDLQISDIIQTKKPNATQKKINKLWQQIQKQKQKNLKQQTDLNSYLALYQDVIYPFFELIDNLINFPHQSIGFAQRKDNFLIMFNIFIV